MDSNWVLKKAVLDSVQVPKKSLAVVVVVNLS